MNKNTKILLGVGAVAIGYFVWKNTQKEEMASATGHKRNVMGGARKKKFEIPKWLKKVFG